MNESKVESALFRRGEEVRGIGPTQAHVEAVVGAARREGRRVVRPIRRGLRVPALGLAVVLLVSGGAVAATNVLSPDFQSFLEGGGPPGEALSAVETPTWIREGERASGYEEASLVASAGTHRLVAYRGSEGEVCFGFDEDYGECRPPSTYRAELAKNPIVVRGPIYDHHGGDRWNGSLFGYVAGSIDQVRIDSSDGSSVTSPAANGAFVIPISLLDHPTRLVGLGAGGEEVASVDLTQRVEMELKSR